MVLLGILTVGLFIVMMMYACICINPREDDK